MTISAAKLALTVLLGGSLLLVQSGCQKPASPPVQIKLTGGTMGTFYEVSLPIALKKADADELQNKIESLLIDINRQMSTYQADSEISRFNSSESTEWFPVSDGFAIVVSRALEIAAQTEGAFDPTVAPLVDLWHFGPEISEHIIPEQSTIDSTLKSTGYKHIDVRLSPPAIRKDLAAVQLDLSAIAKGYGVDEVGTLLSRNGLDSFLVNIGGEVLAVGLKGDGKSWRVGIETPDAKTRSTEAIATLSDEAMATSGDYRNFYEIDGQQFSHTINPQTGRPVEHQLHSISIVANDCLSADAYATALMVMGPEAGESFASQHELQYYMIYGQTEALQTKSSQGFPLQ